MIRVLTSVALGGVAWLRCVLRAEPHVKPDAPTALALRTIAAAATGAALAQAAVVLVGLTAVADAHGAWPLAAFFETTFALTATARVVLAAAVAALAFTLARRAAPRLAWTALTVTATLLAASSAVVSHAVARVEWRVPLIALDAAHQVAAALCLGGLALTLAYVGDLAAFVGTAYGVMVLSKVALLVPALALAWLNMRAVHRAAQVPGTRLFSFVEIELGLGITILFAAASLTSLPPAVDVTTDRATVAEVAARFAPAAPRLTSPPIDELLRAADPLMGRQVERKPVERAWSEYNHHWAGLFVVTMGALAILHFLGLRAARHWPLVFLGLAAFLFIRNDPRAWPLGPAGFWESLTLPDVLQHRTFVFLLVAFALFEWMVRTGRLAERPWGYVFPLLCAAGGGLLLTHSHAMFNLKDEFLSEVTHAPLGILGAFAGWGRWLELRLSAAGRPPGWTWRGCFTAVGLILLFYREG